MASIFTGLAFMHGHIVDRELVMRLGREEAPPQAGAGVSAGTRARVTPSRKARPRAAKAPPVPTACATCC